MRKLIVVPNLSLGIREYASVTEIERRHSNRKRTPIAGSNRGFFLCHALQLTRGGTFSACPATFASVGKVYSRQNQSKVLRKGYERSSIARSWDIVGAPE